MITAQHNFAQAQEAYGVLFALLRLEFAKFVKQALFCAVGDQGWDWSHLITATISSSPITTVIQSSGNGDTELEVLSPSSDSWTEAQIPDLCTSWTSVAQQTCVQLRALLNKYSCLTLSILLKISRRRTRDLKVLQLRGDLLSILILNLMTVGWTLAYSWKGSWEGSWEGSWSFSVHVWMRKINRFGKEWINVLKTKLIRSLVQWWIGCQHWKRLVQAARVVQRVVLLPSSDGTAGCTTGPMIFAPSYLESRDVCFLRSQHAWLDEGQATEFVTKLRTGNWIRFRQYDCTCGSYEGQEHENHLLLEKPKPFELQTDQRGNVCLHWKGEHQVERCNSLRNWGETRVATRATKDFWKSAGSGRTSCKEHRKTFLQNGTRSTKCTFTSRRLRNLFLSYQQHQEVQLWMLKGQKC